MHPPKIYSSLYLLFKINIKFLITKLFVKEKNEVTTLNLLKSNKCQKQKTLFIKAIITLNFHKLNPKQEIKQLIINYFIQYFSNKNTTYLS